MCIPVKINQLEREITELDRGIKRAKDKGRIVKADNLYWKRGYIMEAIEDLKDAHN